MKDKISGRSNERSAACSICGKTFARSDTLLRHEKNHHSTDTRGPIHRVTDGTFRACQACAKSRSRCSGGVPCGRCNVRQLECVYPNKRRKASAPSDNGIITNGHTDKPGVVQFDQIVFASNEDVVMPDHRRVNGDLSLTISQPTQPVTSLSSILSPNTTFDQPPDLQMQTSVLNANNMTETTQVVHNDHFGYNGLVPSQDANFAAIKTPFDYSAFDEPLNWIPPSIYPSPYDAELEQDFSFILPTLSETPNFDTDYTLTMPIDSSTQQFQIPSNAFQIASDAPNVPPPFAALGQSPASSASDGAHNTMSVHSLSTNSEFKRKRRKASVAFDAFAQPRKQSTTYAFPEPADSWASLTWESTAEYCSRSTYDVIFGLFQKLCLGHTSSVPFSNPSFPFLGAINACIALYLENFQHNFPIIHHSSFGVESHWLVILAAAALGSSFAKAPYVSELRDALQEFLRRAVGHYADGVPDTALDLPLAQARILNLVGLTQSDREQVRALSPRYHADISRWCLESGVLQLKSSSEALPSHMLHDSTAEKSVSWKRWIRTESLRRVGYISWMLDCALGYMANARPLCNMDDARTPLPCLESIWSAADAECWAIRAKNVPEAPSLCAALEKLYSNKKVDPSYSEFSQILIVHALYQRTWEVGTHIKQPLSEWVPTGKSKGFLNTPTKDNFWLPLYPLYANWRNSACDCLDVLHWQASSVVAKASGVEHHLVLHLHLARIVLLTPFQEIQDLLFSLIGKISNSPQASFYVHDGSYQPRNTAKLTQIRKITWRWLREDQHKARLAMVHAGSVFWYVRRYSAASFFEPLAVYLASLVLWTYGSYKSAALERDAAAAHHKAEGGPSGPDADAQVQPSRMERKERPATFMSKAVAEIEGSAPTSMVLPLSTSPHLHAEGTPDGKENGRAASPAPSHSSQSSDGTSSSDEQPEFIHLDRPCDDEMVQHFVRNGHNMSGHMTNVGDICQVPHKVLLEGAKLLRTKLACWGVSREYYDILIKLAELRKAT